VEDPEERPPLDRSTVEAAIEDRAFQLVYQPIVDLDRGVVAGVEALCRCADGTPADLWFPSCEWHGLASAMDVAVLELALRDLADLPAGYVSLNLSATTLEDAPPRLLSLVADASAARQVVIELTEHAAVRDYPATNASLAALREVGVLFAVDDAGAGHSTFRHIVRLGPDIIKIDRSITQQIDDDPTRRALVGAMVMFAGDVGAVVVAEGIETAAELAAVRAAGVSTGQGYGLAPPQRLPLAPLDYEPLPFVDLVVARGTAIRGGRALSTTDTMTVHRMRSGIAAMEQGVRLLREAEERFATDELRTVGTTLARQLRELSDDLDDLAGRVRGRAPSSFD
jgi:EAL domain-containing protein (putative c-di-GMP-specific phosphodiesterase class I)